jgi:hypothetical protein
MKPIGMPLRRHLTSFFGRRDHEQDGEEVIASVESSCVCATKRKLNFFWKARNIQFERSRAPSPDSMIVKYSKEVSTGNFSHNE